MLTSLCWNNLSGDGLPVVTELLRVNQLVCERDERLLFKGLNFTLNTGGMLQVTGANGSGKTSLLRILATLTDDYEGEIYFAGQAIQAVLIAYRQQQLYIGHAPGIKGPLTPIENLRWLQGWYQSLSLHTIENALAKVGLHGYEDVPCYSLSAGQQRRVALAQLYLSHQTLWILDEPFTAIDLKGVQHLEAFLAEQASQGRSIILTTHHQLNVPDGLVKKLNVADYGE
ncbi:cytochrome c biogenesis heme-transporting ATPase CcmA [Zooshikella ganghwensis]|uniref:cytochrome c biogenesis heme-transporting ATPase CcmA n=1 Tax=Zooshikella ganghwensis TaxID=202772 RepID=UPI001E4DA016|nr:cytochrome c biogenesis heme-transporting ATPase CcmA [Zooshikella ganghwensis]